MPTDTAATWPCSGFAAMARLLSRVSTASASATNPPVIAAVRLQHVAVDGHRALPQTLEVHDRPQRPADEPLNLLGAARLFTAGRFARRARMRRPGQHAVLGGHPALRLAA